MKEQILKEFEDKYSSFELCNQVSKPELDKLKYFISKAIDQTREETIRDERKRIYAYIEEMLIGSDNELLKDLSNIIFNKIN